MRRLLTTVAVAGACVLIAAPAGQAAAGASVIADCNAHGKLTRTYSDAQLRDALTTMPADVKEYTNCYDVIQHALLGQVGGSPAGGSGGSGSSGGSFLPAWLIVVLVLLALAGLTLGAIAIRRRSTNP